MLNQLPIKGNLGKDVQVASSGKAAYFTVATSKWIKDNEYKTIWWECKVINQKLVNKVAGYKAGTTVKLTGEIDEDEYNGQKKKVLIVLEVDAVIKSTNNAGHAQTSNEGNYSSNQNNTFKSQNNSQPSIDGMSEHGFNTKADPFSGTGRTIDIDDSDLPF